MASSVSVVMPVFNAEKYVDEAISSLLLQTRPPDRIILVDDASRDSTGSKLADWSKRKSIFCIITNTSNQGVARSLNQGLRHVREEYIARMDADDICMPTRLHRQLTFMQTRADIGVCGTTLTTIERSPRTWTVHPEHERIRAELLFNNAMYHPTVMIRTSVLHEFGTDPYEVGYPYAEDYALWVKMSDRARFHNLNEPLLRRRVHADAVGQMRRTTQMESATRIRLVQLKRLGLRDLSQVTLDCHEFLSALDAENPVTKLQLQTYATKLLTLNVKNEVYDNKSFQSAVLARLKTVTKKLA